MEIKTNGDFNKIQINFSEDKTADGKIIKQGILVSIREDSVSKAYGLYQELMRKLEGKKEPEKKAKKEKTKKEPEGIETPTCECGNQMILRNGKFGMFFSCSTYPVCRLTKPYQGQKGIPVDEAQIAAESIPF